MYPREDGRLFRGPAHVHASKERFTSGEAEGRKWSLQDMRSLLPQQGSCWAHACSAGWGGKGATKSQLIDLGESFLCS